jgi:hypothetical protein
LIPGKSADRNCVSGDNPVFPNLADDDKLPTSPFSPSLPEFRSTRPRPAAGADLRVSGGFLSRVFLGGSFVRRWLTRAPPPLLAPWYVSAVVVGCIRSAGLLQTFTF